MYVYTSAYAQKLFGALCSKRKNMVFSLIAFVLLLFLHWCSVSSVADFAIIKIIFFLVRTRYYSQSYFVCVLSSLTGFARNVVVLLCAVIYVCAWQYSEYFCFFQYMFESALLAFVLYSPLFCVLLLSLSSSSLLSMTLFHCTPYCLFLFSTFPLR